MQIQFDKKFFKDLSAIGSKQRKQVEKFLEKNTSNPENIEQSGKLEKLKGYQNYHKIRIGDYRIDIRLENDVCYFERVLHRKEVYKKFP